MLCFKLQLRLIIERVNGGRYRAVGGAKDGGSTDSTSTRCSRSLLLPPSDMNGPPFSSGLMGGSPHDVFRIYRWGYPCKVFFGYKMIVLESGVCLNGPVIQIA